MWNSTLTGTKKKGKKMHFPYQSLIFVGQFWFCDKSKLFYLGNILRDNKMAG